ncbi:MAG: PA0069 family radical SAM protein [Bacteroidetes bacterium]|nr:PA0069 family radical SAM protein [Rhodothermia bacterium]MCS7155795.1 PA0069 family radical SAM protein [Bacteroidota bacterium]MCX7906104.1 PA0069 family radical SAM protein [Bacteroidota bacterium]MDW8138232.1 PA0069 family radical SAM protein [Bacteroidota bacterium]MDW8285916.1 PA0069 family radical SAM protein [Bacteroidota bacterium]
MRRHPPLAKGRGAAYNPPNRFEPLHVELPSEELAPYFEPPEFARQVSVQVYRDRSQEVLSENRSPDVGFRYSLNPYRGCEHGCIYCYARPTHEYWGFSSGLDFETRIVVKLDAPELLARAFRSASWRPQPVVLAPNTDAYQPLERRLGLTRRCLEVFLAFRNPVAIITKNALILRDVDLLQELARLELVTVTISLTTLDPELRRHLEPRTSTAARRLEAIARLRERGVPVGVNIAPVIPGLTDHEIPRLLQEAAQHGAQWAGYGLLRLPYAVKELFEDWLARTYPDRSDRVLGRIRAVREGKLNTSAFGYRMVGSGPYATFIGRLFVVFARRYGLDRPPPQLCTTRFRRVPEQEDLFEVLKGSDSPRWA